MNRKYVLAIKRNNNDYLPLEWNLTPFYKGQNMSTLEGIDDYTSQMSETDLLLSVVNLNILSVHELFQGFAIIYQEKGRIRELKDGAIFLDSPIFDTYGLIDFIINNMTNRKLINRIYNICATIKETSEALEKFKLALNNLDVLYEHNVEAPRIALNAINEIPYPEQRSILVRFSTKVFPVYMNEIEPPKENKKVNDEGKIA